MGNDVRIDDPIIRAELCKQFARSDGKVVAEWNIGSCRIDLAVITASHMHGVEIKSPCDSLNRLRTQAGEYGRVFDVCTLVAARAHVEKAAEIVPDWWGITEVIPSGRVQGPGIMLLDRRRPGINPGIDVDRLAWLLWCRELRGILVDANLITIRRESKARMIEIVRKNFTLSQFRPLVLAVLLKRTDWRRDVAEEHRGSIG